MIWPPRRDLRTEIGLVLTIQDRLGEDTAIELKQYWHTNHAPTDKHYHPETMVLAVFYGRDNDPLPYLARVRSHGYEAVGRTYREALRRLLGHVLCHTI